MEFDTPEEVEKEFPGLYGKPEQVEMSDPVDYDEELDKKKKKDKKDSKKDKGYATLADENSQDEEDESHQAKKKLKGLLSGKKKDKDKDKEHKESKKEKKLLEKEKKSAESERKSADKEGPFSSARIPFSAERHRDINAHRSSVPTALFASTPKSKDKSGAGDGSPVAVVEKERSSSSAFNAFINAPTPLFLQKKKKKEEKEVKEKEHKKDKSKSKDKKEDKEKDKEKHPSAVAKVKLKLMRSKNSLEDPHEKGELHVSVSHQFPEETEALAKEIRKHEALLEQTHGQLKSCKKVTKKQEEHLWELQRTLTALKRKLRSINALSTAAPGHCHTSTGPSTSVPVSESALSKGTCPDNNTIIPPRSAASSDMNEHHTVKQGCETEGFSKKQSISSSSSPLGDVTIGKDEESPPSIQQGCDVSSKNALAAGAEIESQPDSVIIAPLKKSARRSLDFSGIVVENTKKPVKSNNESRIQPCCSAVESCIEDGNVDESLDSSFVESSQCPRSPARVSPLSNNTAEHETMEVHVIVHQESKEEDDEDEVDMGGRGVDVEDDDSSVARSEEDDDEALPSISSRTEENINVVLDDANAMIGSMHEELEAAAFVFGQKFSKRGGGGQGQVFKHVTTVSKSEPTFETNDSSDVELIRDEDEEDELPESFIEELIPELLCLPEFETPEYLSFENEQLAAFNKSIQEEITKEETELEAVMEELENIRVAENNDKLQRTDDESLEDDCDMEQLIETWRTVKSENDALQANVSRLRHIVALYKLDEFRLETRLRFLEDKVQPIISPITETSRISP